MSEAVKKLLGRPCRGCAGMWVRLHSVAGQAVGPFAVTWAWGLGSLCCPLSAPSFRQIPASWIVRASWFIFSPHLCAQPRWRFSMVWSFFQLLLFPAITVFAFLELSCFLTLFVDFSFCGYSNLLNLSESMQ